MNRKTLSFAAALTVGLFATTAGAQSAPSADRPPSPASQAPTVVGGHFGMALPIATLARKSSVIGDDFVTVGLTPGVTVHLDERWAIDFEFIAFDELKKTPSATTLVVDPGVLYKRDGFVTGLRVAMQVGAPTNVGLVPIVVVPIKVSERLSWFVEGDLPLFLRDDGDKLRPSATLLFQTGVGF